MLIFFLSLFIGSSVPPRKYPGKVRWITIDSSRVKKGRKKQLIIPENNNHYANYEFRT